MKLTGVELRDKMEHLVTELRRLEKEKSGDGYANLEFAKKDLPDDMYLALKECLNSPDKKFICNVDYTITNKK